MGRSANQVTRLQIGSRDLHARLAVPAHAKGLVVIAQCDDATAAHGAQRFVLAVLHRYGLATLRLALPAAGNRAVAAVASWADDIAETLAWLPRHERWERAGLMSAGAEAAAVLQAAPLRPASISAIVVSAGDMDVAGLRPLRVRAPTLLIVGGRDDELLPRHRELLRDLQCEKRLEIVPGASRRFEEPGALDAMAQMAAHWFADHTDSVAAA